MEDRLARLEATMSDLREQGARTEEKVDSILHWIHNGGNPTGTERRIRHLEQWRAFLAGTGAALTAALTAAIAWVARGN